MNQFNEYGNPRRESALATAQCEIESLCDSFFRNMVEGGAGVVEIRAMASILEAAVACSASMFIMEKQVKMRKSPVKSGTSVMKKKSAAGVRR